MKHSYISKKQKLVLASCILSCLNLPSYAEDRTVELDELVVVANKQARPIQEVVGTVSVFTAEELEQTQSFDISDALRYEGNIHMEHAGNRFGTTGINIRGMGENRVAILVDGVPIADQFDIGSYSQASALFPDVALIQSIEILNGPASTLYGSDALGGVVSIQTWNPFLLSAQNDGDSMYKFKAAYNGSNHSRNINATGAWQANQSATLLSFTQQDGKGKLNHDSSEAFKDISDWDQQNAWLKWRRNLSHGGSLSVAISGHNNNQVGALQALLGTGRFRNTSALSYQDQHRQHGIQINHDWLFNNGSMEQATLKIYANHSEFDQQTQEDRTSRGGSTTQNRRFEYLQDTWGFEFNLHQRLETDQSSHRLVYGLTYTQNDIVEQRDATQINHSTGQITNNLLGEQFPLRDFPKSKVAEWGLFIHDEIALSDDWTLIPAIRYDHYRMTASNDDLFDGETTGINSSDFSPKLGLLYDINDHINVYLQYVRGFRAAPFSDVNIALNVPFLNTIAIANPNLKSETSDGYELGLRWFGEQQQWQASFFYTDYQDLIESKAQVGFDPVTNALIFQSINVQEANIFGAELDYQWDFHANWQAQLNLSVTHGKNKQTNQYLNSISPAKAVAQLQWHDENQRWFASLYGIHSQRNTRVYDPDEDLFVPPAYTSFDLLLAHHFNQNTQLKFAIHNLTNKKYWLWQQVRHFDANDAVIESLSQAPRHFSVTFNHQW